MPVVVAILILPCKTCPLTREYCCDQSPSLSCDKHDVPKMLDILFASFISNMEAAFCSVCSHKPNRNLQYISVGAENAKRKEQISIDLLTERNIKRK